MGPVKNRRLVTKLVANLQAACHSAKNKDAKACSESIVIVIPLIEKCIKEEIINNTDGAKFLEELGKAKDLLEQ